MPVTGLRAPQEGGQGKPPGPLKSLPVPRRDQTMRRVELGKRLPPSGSWRPLHLEHIALEACRIPVVPPPTRERSLASRLPGFAKRQCFTARAVTGLLVKLAFCRDEGRLSLGDQVFWNRPRCKVLLAAEGTAGMTKQNFGIAAREAIKQETCALFARCGPFHWHAKPHGSPFSACAVGGDEVSRAAWH